MTAISIVALAPRPVEPEEVPELRRMWWRLRREGVRLPAEPGLIVIEGGR